MFAYINTITHSALNIRRPSLILCISQPGSNWFAFLITPAVCTVFFFRICLVLISDRYSVIRFAVICAAVCRRIRVFPGLIFRNLIFRKTGFSPISRGIHNRRAAQDQNYRHKSAKEFLPPCLLHVKYILPSSLRHWNVSTLYIISIFRLQFNHQNFLEIQRQGTVYFCPLSYVIL